MWLIDTSNCTLPTCDAETPVPAPLASLTGSRTPAATTPSVVTKTATAKRLSAIFVAVHYWGIFHLLEQFLILLKWLKNSGSVVKYKDYKDFLLWNAASGGTHTDGEEHWQATETQTSKRIFCQHAFFRPKSAAKISDRRQLIDQKSNFCVSWLSLHPNQTFLFFQNSGRVTIFICTTILHKKNLFTWCDTFHLFH